MRKLITITVLLSVFFSLSAQVARLKLTHGYTVNGGYSSTTSLKAGEWKLLDDPVFAVVRTEEGRVQILNQFEDDFIITSKAVRDSGKDADGDWWDSSNYEVLDQDGKTCYLTIRLYRELTNVILLVMYSNFTYTYSGNVL